MIVDCFTFFNEFDLLGARLEYLYKKVNYFVIAESNVTFSGQPKKFNFIENITRYSYYLDRIIYIPCVPPFDLGNTYWGVEHFQRNSLAKMMKFFDDDDYVLMGDLDEIPSFSGIDRAIDGLKSGVSCTMIQDTHYYNLKQKSLKPWCGTVVTRCKEMKDKAPQEIRDMRDTYPYIHNSGWHLSHWGGAEKIKEKLLAGSHREMNTDEYTDTDRIQRYIDQGVDLYDRPWEEYIKTLPEQFEPFFYSIFSRFG